MARELGLVRKCPPLYGNPRALDMRPCPAPLSLALFGPFQVVLSYVTQPGLQHVSSMLRLLDKGHACRTKTWQDDRKRLTYTEHESNLES